MGKNMKRKNIAILTIVIIIGLICALTLDIKLKYDISLIDYAKYNSGLTATEEALIKEKPLNFGIYEEPPLAFTNEFNNYNAGIVTDYISQLAIETKSNVNMKIRSEESITEALKSNEIDFTILENTPENSREVDLSIPLFVVKTKVLVPAISDINNIRDLSGKTFVALRADNGNGRIESLFDEEANVEIIEVENMYQCIALLRNILMGIQWDVPYAGIKISTSWGYLSLVLGCGLLVMRAFMYLLESLKSLKNYDSSLEGRYS